MMFKYSHSSITVDKGISHLKLNEKDYYHTGYAYGQLLVKSNNHSVKFLKSLLTKTVLSTLYFITKRYYKNIKIPQEYLDEIRGYADSTGISYKYIFLLNFGFDVLTRYGFHCSTISFFNKDSVLVGRNTDVPPGTARLAIKHAKSLIVDISLPNKKRFVHVSPPLFVGSLNGFNEDGIAANSHQIRAIKEIIKDNKLATPLLVRILLENATDLKSAERIAKNNITTRALNIMITSKKERRSIILEIHPNKMNLLHNDMHTSCVTFFQSKDMYKLHNGPVELAKTRLKLMQELVNNHKNISYEEFITILKDHRNGMKYPQGRRSITNAGTLQSFIFDLTNNVIIISNGDKIPVSLTGEYVKIKV